LVFQLTERIPFAKDLRDSGGGSFSSAGSPIPTSLANRCPNHLSFLTALSAVVGNVGSIYEEFPIAIIVSVIISVECHLALGGLNSFPAIRWASPHLGIERLIVTLHHGNALGFYEFSRPKDLSDTEVFAPCQRPFRRRTTS
jgi:hypothetical protein